MSTKKSTEKPGVTTSRFSFVAPGEDNLIPILAAGGKGAPFRLRVRAVTKPNVTGSATRSVRV